MKRLLIMFTTTAAAMTMMLGAVATAEATEPPREERTVYGRYRMYPSPVTGCNEVVGSWACMVVRTLPTERFVSVKVTDIHGLPVFFLLSNPRSGFWEGFCGETQAPVPFGFGGRDLEIEVGVSRGLLPDTDCPESSVKTKGRIKVTLSN